MSRFGYFRDPLFLTSLAAYAVNQAALKPSLHSAFLHGQFNDLLVIPAALPPLLWAHRRVRLRLHDLPPTPAEITLHVVLWSLICEVVGPLLLHRGTADFRDALAYALGGLLAGLWWNRRRDRFPHRLPPATKA